MPFFDFSDVFAGMCLIVSDYNELKMKILLWFKFYYFYSTCTDTLSILNIQVYPLAIRHFHKHNLITIFLLSLVLNVAASDANIFTIILSYQADSLTIIWTLNVPNNSVKYIILFIYVTRSANQLVHSFSYDLNMKMTIEHIFQGRVSGISHVNFTIPSSSDWNSQLQDKT